MNSKQQQFKPVVQAFKPFCVCHVKFSSHRVRKAQKLHLDCRAILKLVGDFLHFVILTNFEEPQCYTGRNVSATWVN